MNKTKMTYFKDEDILHLLISEEKEAGSIELSPNITAELNAKGELISRYWKRAPSLEIPSWKPLKPGCLISLNHVTRGWSRTHKTRRYDFGLYRN